MTPSPRVSVVMSVYNGEKYLAQAIESILDQTFRDYEFIIIDDGSTDGTGAILKQYQEKDDRIQVCDQENKGLIAALNRGCRLAKGEFIARMDADDISLPERLAKQVRYLEAHPEVGVLGTWIEFIDERGIPRGEFHFHSSPILLGWSFLFGNCLAHSSVFMRRTVVERLGFYNPSALHVEDYDLWTRAKSATLVANLAEVLIERRVWSENISSRHSRIQEESTVGIMGSIMAPLLGGTASLEIAATLRQVVTDPSSLSPRQMKSAACLIVRLYRAYVRTNSPSRLDTRGIAQDAAIKLYLLADSARKGSLRTSFGIAAQMIRLGPHLLISRELAIKGARKLTRSSLRE
ncbi:MAG: glycosyltransferase [Candidatus Marsarchaeota archaeon]|nr:glycosyltransferase [Candidatus Marsarchaeota archaeon]